MRSAEQSPVERAFEFCAERAQRDTKTVQKFAAEHGQKMTVPAFLGASAMFSQMFPESASAAQLLANPAAAIDALSAMPLAAVEVGKHWYWDLPNGMHVHGQVIFVTWIIFAALLAFGVSASGKKEREPTGVQNVGEYAIEFIEDIARQNIGEHDYREWVPFVGTLFLFIFASNWAGALVPWKLVHIPEGELAAPTNDINTTASMALLVSLAYFYAGFKGAGLGYFTRYVKPTPILLPINIIEDFTKPLSLSFRLFGNILADELVVSVLILLIPVVVPLPAMLLGLFASAIQALIFATLASVYIGEAVEVGHELEHEKHAAEH
eukprot:tig00001033_g6498.t1